MSTDSKMMLESSDGVKFEVDLAVVECSQLLMDVIVATGIESPIPLPNVSSNILMKVIEYSTYHLEFKRLTGENSAAAEEELKRRDADFVQVEHGTLLGLINAADYLDIKSLLELTCQKVVDMLTGKTPDEIRRYLGIMNDFTPEEEETNRRLSQWTFD